MSEELWQLISVAELQGHAELGNAAIARLERVVKLASRVVERQGLRGRRVVVPAADVVEYYTPELGQTEIYMRSWPPGIVELAERSGGGTTYTALTEGQDEDYVVTSDGKLTRVSAGEPTSWPACWRGVRLTHRNGHATTTAVPEVIKDVTLRLAARLWKEAERGQWGYSAFSDEAGNFTRIGQTMLTKDDRRQLEEADEALIGVDLGWEQAA